MLSLGVIILSDELDETSIKIEEQKIKICVKFVSEQFKNNDENTIVKKQDVWTFEKPTISKDPNWMLSST